MYTVFHPELADLARTLHTQHTEFLAGTWSAERLDRHQLDGFRRTLAYAGARSPMYRNRLGAIDADRITSLSFDQFAGIPFTTKDDLRTHQFDVLSRPVSQAWVYYETTGTTGASTPAPRGNLDSLHTNMALTFYYETILRRIGADQIIGISGPSELHATGDTFGEVCRNLGIAVAKLWPQSPLVGYPRALRVMDKLGITGLFCTPSMAMSLAAEAVAAGLDPRRDLGVKVVMLTGEIATPALLDNIASLWGAETYNALYGSQEASVLGAGAADGGLYLTPLINHYEVIDPTTLRQAPAAANGVRQGELVVTHLYQGSKPLIRYRTGDLVRVHPAVPGTSIPAGRLEVLGRAGDRLEINGVAISAYDLEDLLLRHLRGYLDYRIVIGRHVDGEADAVTLVLPRDFRPTPAMIDGTVEDCLTALGTMPKIVNGDPGAVGDGKATVSWKTARIIDHRTSTATVGV
ncbi:MAG TPA: phenylacetate--CoA ligase family protein [Pseudonocardiaceae bacterium]|jgi:phenylacetate-CoA ligase|nr:phenylacetate--CoA ligase family protein [Pseudonocardiaceae bacterium]